MRLTRFVRASATPSLLTCLALAAIALAAAPTPALARVHTKPCARIKGCTAVLRPPVLPTTTQTPTPMSHFGVVVKTAPTSTLGTASKPGTLVFNQLLGNPVSCAGYTPRADTTFAFQLRTATPLHINYVVTDRLTNTTAQGIQACLAAPFTFKTLSGKPAAPTKLPDGTPGFVGVLPACANAPDTAPCLMSVTTVPDTTNSSTGVDVILRARVPSTTKGGATTTEADPWIHP
jgi:hypothetical protein